MLDVETTDFIGNTVDDSGGAIAVIENVQYYINECNFENVSSSQIIPIITGDNERTLKASEFFKEHGIYAMPIRHPTVPAGKGRLRISLNAGLNDSQIEMLADTIRAFSRK